MYILLQTKPKDWTRSFAKIRYKKMQKEREREVGHAQKNSDLTYAALPLPHRRQIVVIQIIRPRAPFEHRETIVLAPRKSRDEAIGRETRRCSRFHRNHRPRKFMRSGTANLSPSPRHIINMKQRKAKDVQATMRREK